MTHETLTAGLGDLAGFIHQLKAVQPVTRNGDSRWHVPVPRGAERDVGREIQTEIELSLLLFGMILQLKPKVVIESGTDLGVTAAIMGLACRINGFGEVFSAEIDGQKVIRAEERCRDLPVRILHGNSLERLPYQRADLGFIDGAQQNRLEELRRMKKGSTAVLHDTRLFSDEEMWQVTSHRHLLFETSRGFTVVKK